VGVLEFTRNDYPTIGVEIELALVDAQTFALKSSAAAILKRVPERFVARFKPELVQCCLELNTEICRDVAEVETDLSEKLRIAEQLAEAEDTRLYWTATHPFSPWYAQDITPDPRYLGLVELLQDTARRLITFGLHMHIGVESGEKAVLVCERIMNHLPTLLALSVNSPFWNGRPTGLHSQRSKLMDNLPTAGLPPLMRNWSEYVWLVNHLVETGFINTIREIWWDVRPHNNFGTVEVRMCDLPPSLDDVLALTALVQCLVHSISREIDSGTYQHDCHPMMVRQNKWRACRHGMAAELVEPYSHAAMPARKVVRGLVERLREVAVELRCEAYLGRVLEMTKRPTGADRQLAIFKKTGDATDIVRRALAGDAARP
jgi:carboxylate-amine ligase